MVRICTILSIVILQSCFPIVFNRNKFILKEKYTVNEIKTEGYYYSIFSYDSIDSYYKGEGIRMRVFLNNGYTYRVGKGYGDYFGDTISLECDIKMSESMLDEYLNLEVGSSYKRNHAIDLWGWGKYKIDGDTIFIQRYINGYGDYYLVEEEGKVNDSASFTLFRRKSYKEKKSFKINEFYQFKTYDVKKIYDEVPNNL